MKYSGLLLAVILGSGTVAAGTLPARAADPTFSDTLCPRAVPKVTTLNSDVVAKSDYTKLVDDARAVSDAYLNCTTDARSTFGIAYEPVINYDQTRTAQYLVVLGRLQAATGNVADAIASFKSAHTLAINVADWIPDAEVGSASNGLAGNSAGRNKDRQPSRYKDAAVQIKASAEEELAKLGAGPAPAPSSQPSP